MRVVVLVWVRAVVMPVISPVMIAVMAAGSGQRITHASQHAPDSALQHINTSEDPAQAVVATASLVSSTARQPSLPPVAPQRPATPPAAECERFIVPAELVPISKFVDVRPVGTTRPYGGGAVPELTAWLRLTEDDQPPDLHRLVLLMDALAPSYAAVLTSPKPIPTVELTVRTADGSGSSTSPWILLQARTTWASPDGWLHEHLEAWDPAGMHLASAGQLRAVAGTTAATGAPA